MSISASVSKHGLGRDPAAVRASNGAVTFWLAVPLLVLIWLGAAAPRALSVTVLGHRFQAHDLRVHLPSSLYFLLGGLACLMIAEICSVGWRDSALRRLAVRPSPSTRSDLVVFITQHCGVFGVLQLVTTLGLLAWLGAQLQSGRIGAFIHAHGLSHAPFLAQLAMGYLAYTFCDYWAHRLAHSRYFWPLHRFHHAADDFCILTSSRVHPSDVTSFILVTAPLLVLNLSPEALAMLGGLIGYVRLAIHSRIRGDLGWLGATIVQAPTHHHLHHSLDPALGSSNYSICPLWDRLFGTWRPIDAPQAEIGVDTPYRHGAWFLPDFARDYLEFLGGLAGLAGLAGLGATRPPPVVEAPRAAMTAGALEG